MFNRKSQTKDLKTVLLNGVTFVVIFALLGGILVMILSNFNKEGCSGQIKFAAKGNAVSFSACHNYRLEFGEKSAVKKDINLGNKKVGKPYVYDTVVKKIEKEIGRKLIPEEDELEYAIYYIIAQEIKNCDYQYYPIETKELDLKNLGVKYGHGTVCKQCIEFVFDHQFFEGKQFDNLGGFLSRLPYDRSESKSINTVLSKKYPYSNTEEFLEYFTDLKIRGSSDNLFLYNINKIKPPGKFDLTINTRFNYEIFYSYFAYDEKSKKPTTLKPLFVNILTSNERYRACQGELGFG